MFDLRHIAILPQVAVVGALAIRNVKFAHISILYIAFMSSKSLEQLVTGIVVLSFDDTSVLWHLSFIESSRSTDLTNRCATVGSTPTNL